MDFSETIRIWRHDLLSAIADAISHQSFQAKQKELGLWKHGEGMSYPDRGSIKIIDDESLTFSAKIGLSNIMFSIWVMFGEIRIGVKMPIQLANTVMLQDKISMAYSGKFLAETNKKGSDILFDWIWANSEFAAFEYMTNALISKPHTGVIVDRMTQIILHLYLSVTAELLEAHRLTATHGQISAHPYDSYTVLVAGDELAFKWHILEKMKGKIISSDRVPKSTQNGQEILNLFGILIPVSSAVNGIAVGSDVFDTSNRRCNIRELKKMPKSTT